MAQPWPLRFSLTDQFIGLHAQSTLYWQRDLWVHSYDRLIFTHNSIIAGIKAKKEITEFFSGHVIFPGHGLPQFESGPIFFCCWGLAPESFSCKNECVHAIRQTALPFSVTTRALVVFSTI